MDVSSGRYGSLLGFSRSHAKASLVSHAFKEAPGVLLRSLQGECLLLSSLYSFLISLQVYLCLFPTWLFNRQEGSLGPIQPWIRGEQSRKACFLPALCLGSFKAQGWCRGPQPHTAGSPHLRLLSGCSSPTTLALSFASVQCPAKPGLDTTEEHVGREGKENSQTPASSSEQCHKAAWAPRSSDQSETMFWVLLHPGSSLPQPSPLGCDLGLSDHP